MACLGWAVEYGDSLEGGGRARGRGREESVCCFFFEGWRSILSERYGFLVEEKEERINWG